jgi:hypothetical protein
MIINEVPSGIWNFRDYMHQPINRSQTTVDEYLKEQGISWIFGNYNNPDFRVYKDENIRNGLLSIRRIQNEYQKRFGDTPYININGEAQEYSRFSYLIADPERTYSAAPGNTFKRLFFPVVWRDPELDKWESRIDRICWIGRPLPERIRLARLLRHLRVPLDIYSKDSWGIPEWKGYARPGTSRRYRYQIVMENSLRDKYHSEKLINSLMDGCVTFYVGDPTMLTPIDGAYMSIMTYWITNRDFFAPIALDHMKQILFSNRWEEYSLKSFFDRIINEARRQTL